ncbi:MAG: hypothetical protein ACRD3G_26120 [Vicinamibacterales bacterium]
MPWRETSPMEQRLEFVREYDSGLFTMTELAAEYGISRKTGFVLRCDALTAHTRAVTRPRVERAFAEDGLPERIRSDNGPPFGGPGLGRLSTLAVWWIRLGILPERIDPGHPEQNGVPRTISPDPQGRYGAASRRHGRGAATPLHALLPRVQPRATA